MSIGEEIGEGQRGKGRSGRFDNSVGSTVEQRRSKKGWKTMIGGPASNKNPRQSLFSILSIPLVFALLLGALAVIDAAPSLQSAGPSGGQKVSVSGSFTTYTPQELWGGGNPSEGCLSCTATSLIGSDKATSISSGQDVDPATGDFSITHTLFSYPAVGTDMGVTLTYDAERSASSSALTSFGEGWDSNFSASLVYNSSAGSIVVNEGNGSQLNFQTPSGSNCPAGSYNDPEKYTLPGSSQSFCAPNRVDAQAGVSFAYNTNELAENGQKSLSTFNYLGQLVYTGDMANPTSVGYQYSISPGSQSNCPTSGEYMCIAETDQFGHSVVAFQNIYGIIGNIWDPIGTDYIIGYGGNVDLESISNGGFDDSTWNFTPQGGAAPYAHEITAVTTPDGGQEQIFYSNGMVSQENAPDGQGTTFTNYTQTTCATSAGCTTNGQNVDVTYPDGEHDLDSYFDGLLVGNEYGADTNFTMADANFGFNYVFPELRTRTPRRPRRWCCLPLPRARAPFSRTPWVTSLRIPIPTAT